MHTSISEYSTKSMCYEVKNERTLMNYKKETLSSWSHTAPLGPQGTGGSEGAPPGSHRGGWRGHRLPVALLLRRHLAGQAPPVEMAWLQPRVPS